MIGKAETMRFSLIIDKETAETAISEAKQFLKEAKLYLEGLGVTF